MHLLAYADFLAIMARPSAFGSKRYGLDGIGPISRFNDAMKNTSESRSTNGPEVSAFPGEMELPERRVALGQEMDIDLTVYGRSSYQAVFYEPARPISGSGGGGAFLLAIPVLEGQELLLINNGTSREQVGSVVSVRIQNIHTSIVSVSFPRPNPDFWNPSGQAGSL